MMSSTTILVRTLFALGACSAVAGAARAQSAVTVYGLLDAGIVVERGCPACPVTKVSSGVASGSRLGVRGEEDLGGGTAAIFALEAGVLGDTGRSDQNGRLFGRQAFVGVKTPGGTVTLGRKYSLQYLALTDVADPFKGGMAGSATNLVGYSGKQVDNTIEYATPNLHGVTAAAAYGLGEQPGDASSNRAWGVSVGFTSGRLTMRAAHQNRNAARITPATPLGNTAEARNSIVAANFDVGVAVAYAAFSVNRGVGSSPLWNPDNPYGAALAATPSTDSRDLLLGFAVPHGATTFLASFIRKNDRDLANRDADQVAIGASYALSRRTDFYAAYSRIKNRRGAGYTAGNATEAGSGNRAVNIGLRHAF